MILSLLACTCAQPEAVVPPPVEELPDIVWVTLDTTRVDRFGSYGGADVTPNFDRLAARGVRFKWLLTHIPATLPAHSSMFTGLDPHAHQVPANGYALAEELETLAERLAGMGYDTIAVVGASVLESAMGLDQGFRIYDDELGDSKKRRFEDRADVVNERVWAALEERDSSRPLFLWVHYFDAHAPYEAPMEWHEQHVDTSYVPSWGAGPFATGDTASFKDLTPEDLAFVRNSYTAEVAWQDHNLGLLIDGLEERDLVEALVVMADHGDLLGDAPDLRFGHAASVSLPVIRVPGMLWAPGLNASVLERPVANSELASTLLARLGWEALGQGEDALTTQARPIFVEATKPKILGPKAQEQGLWNNLLKKRAVLWNDRYLVYAPQLKNRAARLWALGTEMRETEQDEVLITEGRALLQAWDDQAPGYREPDMNPTTRRALEALGYL